MRQTLAVVTEHADPSVVRAVRAGSEGRPVRKGGSVSEALRSPDGLQAVFCDARQIDVLRAHCTTPGLPLVLLADRPDARLLVECLRDTRVRGVLSVHAPHERSSLLTYAARRIAHPAGPAPGGSSLLAWGSTTTRWQVTSAGEIAKMGRRTRGITGPLGLPAWQQDLVAEAMALLLEHALPRCPEGPVHAELTVSASRVELDVREHAGRLSRRAFFADVLAGHQTTRGGAPLARAYRSASTLRAEVEPGSWSQVSWGLDRARAENQGPRAVLFLPRTPREPVELGPEDLLPR